MRAWKQRAHTRLPRRTGTRCGVVAGPYNNTRWLAWVDEVRIVFGVWVRYPNILCRAIHETPDSERHTFRAVNIDGSDNRQYVNARSVPRVIRLLSPRRIVVNRLRFARCTLRREACCVCDPGAFVTVRIVRMACGLALRTRRSRQSLRVNHSV